MKTPSPVGFRVQVVEMVLGSGEDGGVLGPSSWDQADEGLGGGIICIRLEGFRIPQSESVEENESLSNG